MTTSRAVSIEGLTKSFGSFRCLKGFDLAVEEGSVFGFLGPNGAGKTTTLRILCGLAHSDSGTVSVFGRPAGSTAARASIGVLADVPGLYGWMTALEYVTFHARLSGVKSDEVSSRVSTVLDLSGLETFSRRIGGLSRGMKQRLGLAAALVSAPRLLVLDEPTSALDPLGRADVLAMVATLAGRTTVLFSTHILADAEKVCDSFAIIDQGSIVESGRMADVRARTGASVRISVASGAADIATAMGGFDGVTVVRTEGDGSLVVLCADDRTLSDALVVVLKAGGFILTGLEREEAGLEEVFLDVVARRAS